MAAGLSLLSYLLVRHHEYLQKPSPIFSEGMPFIALYIINELISLVRTLNSASLLF